MARGNQLFNRLVRIQDEGAPTPRAASAVHVVGGDRSTAGQVAARAALLLGLTLASMLAAWRFMAGRSADSGDWSVLSDGWQSREVNLVGIAGLVVVAGLLVLGSFRPVSNPVAAAAYAVAQGLLLAWIGVTFSLGTGWFLANALLSTVLTGLAAIAIRRSRWGRRPAVVVVPASAAAGLAALALGNAAAALAGADRALIGPGGALVPWWGWYLLVLLAVWAASSFRTDLRRIDAYTEAGAPARYRWAAALAVAAGPVGIYVWRLTDFRTTYGDQYSGMHGLSSD
ncbi:Bax inhibitor-1/YccA family protein [Glycomyces sp. NRRL B-16210]|uniref:Bax inhibitor-1/YccA family membrane protein n=1 Tax=Glycomyces sp. NRRL B-16210 TaxID=1463821 RepID=UPI0004BF4859|nr:Bax inhibitor-1/YccA family protein [Glycomyces sp. NRRL B-16210]